MSPNNPYLTRTAIRNDCSFFGRSYELKAIISRIYATQPQSTEIIGERRIGKSSLIYAVQRAVVADARQDIVCVMIDGQTFLEADPAKFFQEVIGQMRLQSGTLMEFEIGYDGFRSLVAQFEREGLRLILLIDEFDVITRNLNFKLEFFNFLRSQATNHQVAYVLSTVQELESVCHSDEVSGSPFFNIFFRLQLGPLLLEEARDLIQKPARREGVDLARYQDWIIDRVGRFPFFVHVTCARLFEAVASESFDVDRVERDLTGELKPYFAQMWKRCDAHTQQILLRVSKGNALSDADLSFVQGLLSKGYLMRKGESIQLSALLFKRELGGLAGSTSLTAVELTIDFVRGADDALLQDVVRSLAQTGAEASVIAGRVRAHFAEADVALDACSSARNLLMVHKQDFRMLVYGSRDSAALFPQASAEVSAIEQLSVGEVAVTPFIVNLLSKPVARKLRKRAGSKRIEGISRLFVLRPMSEISEPVFLGVPERGRNNVWYEYRVGETVYVFIHGIFSDSASCWRNQDKSMYWPDLIRTDSRLGGPAIYLAGYFTDISANKYDLDNCEYELFSALNRASLSPVLPPVMSFEKIVLICHSTGGIVARYMLERRYEKFADKRIGLVLIASPSYGAKLANKLDWLARLYGNRLGQQLQWGSWSLQELDSRFKTMISEQKIPGLMGIEAYENKFVISRRFLPNLTFVVSEESAGKYFGPAVLLRNTDHFSAVKPDGPNHPAHEMLVDFCSRFVESWPSGPVAR